MSTETKIEWTARRHPTTGQVFLGGTVNFWIGCTPIDPACAGCYAWAQDNIRNWTPQGWGKGKPRHPGKTAVETALALNRKAAREGLRLAVFTNSLADFFDEEVPDSWRDAALETVLECENLDWLILTKRAANMHSYLTRHRAWQHRPPANVWLGVTAATQKGADERIPLLMATPAVRRFLSMEPLLEAVDISRWVPGVDWVIVGGESESASHPHKARPMHADWVHAIQAECWRGDVPFFFKQWGEWAPAYELDHDPQAQAMCVLGKVTRNDFPTGEAGRRTVFKVGKRVAGRKLDGLIHDATPKILALAQ